MGDSSANDNLAALDLTSRNIKVNGDKISLDFDAKNSHWKQEITDPHLARWLTERMKSVPKGEPLLGHGTSSGKVNKYLSEIGEKAGVIPEAKGKGFTAHNIRHTGATRLASQLVDEIKVDPKRQEGLREHARPSREEVRGGDWRQWLRSDGEVYIALHTLQESPAPPRRVH